MSKSSVFSNPAFQENTVGIKPLGFNLINQSNSFNSVFDIKPLDELEARRIEKLLVDNFQPGKISEEQTALDTEQLKSITADIKAIGRQGIVLIGERVHKAKELLKPYKDGTFTKWLESTFGTRKTGYNMLAYYDLYKSLPHDELRERFKKIPQRVAYILASRDGDIEKKVEIIRDSNGRSQEDLVLLIQETFPVASGDKRVGKDANSKLIVEIREVMTKLRKRKGSLTEWNKKELSELRSILDSIIS